MTTEQLLLQNQYAIMEALKILLAHGNLYGAEPTASYRNLITQQFHTITALPELQHDKT